MRRSCSARTMALAHQRPRSRWRGPDRRRPHRAAGVSAAGHVGGRTCGRCWWRWRSRRARNSATAGEIACTASRRPRLRRDRARHDGLNFFRPIPRSPICCSSISPTSCYAHIEPHLDRLGALAGDHLDQCARLADRHPPVLHHRDRFGRDEQWIEYPPGLSRAGARRLRRVRHPRDVAPQGHPRLAGHLSVRRQARVHAICSIRPSSASAARSTSPTAPRCCSSRFGDDALKAKYLDGLTQTDMARLTQGAQFMTEKEGGSDVGKLTTARRPEGRSLAPRRREMVLLERRRRGGHAAGAAAKARRPARAASASS